MIASQEGGSIYLMLLEETIDINQKSFLKAITVGQLHIVKYLLSSGQVNINMKNAEDIPVLQVAIRKGRLDTARHLLQRKELNLDATDADGNSALHDAALYDYYDIMKLLIEKGCDVMLQNNMCEFPIDLTDNSEMQELICCAMDSYGHEALARQYRTYLSLTPGPAHLSPTEPDSNYPACAAIAPEVINYADLDKSFFAQSAPSINQNNLCVSNLVVRAKPTPLEQKSNTLQHIASHSQLVQSEYMDSDNDSSYSSDNDQCRNMLTDIRNEADNNNSGIRTVEQALMNLKIAFTGTNDSTCVNETSEQVNTFTSPVVRRPRKSSLATFDSRKLSDGRRKSVSFQPEVLLQQIVTEGDVEEIKDVLSTAGVDINRMSPAGLTALHQAAMDGNVECAQTLLLNGGDVNVTDCEGCTPLHTAVICGHTEFVHFLLAAGADPFLKSDDGQIPIQLAEDEKIKKLLRNAMNGKVFDFLYEYGTTSDVESEVSETEEQGGYADDDEYSGEENELEDEVDLSANLTISVNSDDSCIFSSSSSNNRSTNIFGSNFPTLRPRQPISSCSSCESNETEVAEEPRSTGSCRREHPRADSESNPPCSVDTELRVTEAEANYYASEDQGISTMDGSSDGCARKGHCSEDEDTSHRVDPDLEPGSKDYVFQEAVLNCNIEALMKLHRYRTDIDVNRINQSGITALHHAVLEENFALVQHLVKYFNTDVQIKDTDGWSPLHAASAVGDIRTAQFLLENGAKASQLNNNCEFPVDLAQDQAMELLLKNAMLGPTVGKLFTGVLTKNA